MKPGLLGASCWAVMLLCLPGVALAQRQLHWDSVEVDATLEASGALRVAETQTMVFTGAWNGGERLFDLRPRQKLSLISVSRWYPGGWRELTEDSRLDDVDDYAWADARTVRWRSRAASDPPFANTPIRYLLRYRMSGILVKEDAGFLLNHDFLFAERDGNINRFQLRLTLDPAWQAQSAVPEMYTAERLTPGRGFIVTLPLHYAGTAVPIALDSSRPREIVMGVGFLLLALGLGLAAFFAREERHGRFAPLATDIDEAWLGEHVFKYPAEVVGAAWDEGISTPEVVALIARMVSEGKLESTVSKSGSMTLNLKVDRSTLEGHERTLVEALFFGGRVQTSTTQVQSHYKATGFDPVDEIRRELEAAVEGVMPPGPKPPRLRFAIQILFIAGAGLLGFDLFARRDEAGGAIGLVLGSLLLLGVAWGAGTSFRANIHWGLRAAWACLSPTLVAFVAAVAFLWFVAGAGIIESSLVLVAGVIALALAVLLTSIDAMTSRHRAAIRFRKRLASGRAFFISELKKERPALRDEWFPWMLAFGLAKRVDDWSTRPASSTGWTDRSSSTTWSSSSGSPAGWTGFSGGRSGGAGGGAAWVSAASGMAASVSPPSSSSSSGGSSSGSSSSSSSSGGGGGGGW
ncbi:MAG TPA: DUF2207 domain-containing protein [Vicinamibacterales bacterium]|nr:DUF2207 domain-containing protein [Vicinamibacterales bacterium]